MTCSTLSDKFGNLIFGRLANGSTGREASINVLAKSRNMHLWSDFLVSALHALAWPSLLTWLWRPCATPFGKFGNRFLDVRRTVLQGGRYQ